MCSYSETGAAVAADFRGFAVFAAGVRFVARAARMPPPAWSSGPVGDSAAWGMARECRAIQWIGATVRSRRGIQWPLMSAETSTWWARPISFPRVQTKLERAASVAGSNSGASARPS